MSNEAITWAFKQDISNSSAKFVLVVLADHADESWECFPGQQKIARMTGLGERSVRRSLEWLVEHGYIVRRHRYVETGKRTSDRYRLLPANVATGAKLERQGESAGGNQRSDCPEVLPATLTGGQTDRWARPAQTTTGHIDRRPDLQSLPASVAGYEPSVEPSVVSIERARGTTSGTKAAPIPADFAVTDHMRAWAARVAPGADVELETAQFVDYWTSHGARRADWLAMWRQWIRNQAKWSAQRSESSARRPADAGHRAWMNPPDPSAYDEEL